MKVGEKVSMRDVYGKTLLELGRERSDIFVLDADLAASTRTSLFWKEFPERFINAGVAEQDMIGIAAGLCLAGYTVFASTFAVFGTYRAYDQLRQSICYPKLPVKLVYSHGGITVGEDGPTHHACEDIALMRVLPNMAIVIPGDARETEQVIRFAANYTSGPIYIRLPRLTTPVIFDENYKFAFGKAILMHEGNPDIAVLTTGLMTWKYMEASKLLSDIDPTWYHVPTVRPLDPELPDILQNAKLVVTVEEHSVKAGFGSSVAEFLSSVDPKPVVRVGVPETFTESAPAEDLLSKYGLDEKGIAYSVRSAFEKWVLHK